MCGLVSMCPHVLTTSVPQSLQLMSLQIVLLLLEHHVKLNPQDVHMNTPLHFCCNNGHMESATLLMIVSGFYDYYYNVPSMEVCEI